MKPLTKGAMEARTKVLNKRLRRINKTANKCLINEARFFVLLDDRGVLAVSSNMTAEQALQAIKVIENQLIIDIKQEKESARTE